MLANGDSDHIAVLRASACPYARLARLEMMDPIKLRGSVPCYPLGLCSAFQEFVQRSRVELLDGLAIPIVGPVGASTGELSDILFSVLTRLRSCDTTNEADLLAGLESDDWDFEYEGIRFFILALSPSYPTDSTRYCNSRNTSYLLFQPEHSFRRFGISSRNPNRERISQRVRKLFRSHGQIYDDEVTLSLPKRYRYVMRVLPSDAPVRWWSANNEL